MSKAEDRAMAIIRAMPSPAVGFAWLGMCKSPTAFLKTWSLGRQGRRLVMLASKHKKTAAREGLIVARHALIAIEKLAKQIKSKRPDLIHHFINFVVLLGLWAARAAASEIDAVPLTRQKRLDIVHEFQFQI